MNEPSLLRVECPTCRATDSRPERTIAGFNLERCRRCGMVFVNPQPPPAAVASSYTERDAEYLTAFYARSATPTVLAGYRQKVSGFERLLPGKGRLLDFGCGAGYFAEAAAAAGWDALGIDLGKWTEAAAARRGFRGVGGGPLQEMGLPPESFDVVNASQVLEHLPDPQAVLGELVRLIRPGGLLAVDVPNYRTLSILAGRDDFVSNEPPHHLNYFTPRTLGRLLRLVGVRPLQLATAGGLKWENLIGRRIESEVLAAHAATAAAQGGDAGPPPRAVPDRTSWWRAAAKRVVVGGLVRPIFYDRLRVGMLLYATARKC